MHVALARRLASIDDRKAAAAGRANVVIIVIVVAFGCFANRCTTDWPPTREMLIPQGARGRRRRRLCHSS